MYGNYYIFVTILASFSFSTNTVCFGVLKHFTLYICYKLQNINIINTLVPYRGSGTYVRKGIFSRNAITFLLLYYRVHMRLGDVRGTTVVCKKLKMCNITFPKMHNRKKFKCIQYIIICKGKL